MAIALLCLDRLFRFHARRTISERGDKKIFLTRPAHHDESPRRISLVRLGSEDDKQGKAICDHGRLVGKQNSCAALIREKGGDALGRCTMMEARSLRNGIRASIPIPNEQVAATRPL
ncbi:uncharacterized protein TRIVIDRAFT_220850 [Trichoderma virens Gv29-8]|uniref:Uncharacterized protein n=1 Tax=Hypocrea virens (strain Gv29-8 / FGSC 10586) TaxID=413071 RepID=G9MNY9_HYPVG|nr:uncharacterized protein TRIVIDRAFT_220850 [Trichoderma virens Gv29-8]EHK23591.1 hypothetical protein TRIVIDRAFT_220850 [Trichoderma virens Gv29-8]UKZ49890.1 hypothetical protein TrVGV298_004143 [Trichoderma virens]